MTNSASARPGSLPAAGRYSETALSGIYEISKILNAPNRLETTLSSVLNVLSSFLQMRHGVISLLADDDVPDITVGAINHPQSNLADFYRERDRRIDRSEAIFQQRLFLCGLTEQIIDKSLRRSGLIGLDPVRVEHAERMIAHDRRGRIIDVQFAVAAQRIGHLLNRG